MDSLLILKRIVRKYKNKFVSKYAFGTEAMEKAIIEECNTNNGFIKEDKLVSIIKKSPSYPVQEVYTIQIRKVFMRDAYIVFNRN